MTIKIGINGFGRIGRNVLRALIEDGREDIQVVAINDLSPPATSAHLFEFDSVHGRFAGDVKFADGMMDVGRGPIRVTAEREPEKLPWGDVDIALECTGFFNTDESAARHLKNGSDKVLISAPGKGKMKTIVYGVNHGDLTSGDTIVSNASCTTNCLAPLANALHAAFGVKRGHMTTIHSYTGDQALHDGAHKDLYRARAGAVSMVPTTTGAAKAIALVLPELEGRIDGTAIRVPTPNVSCVDLVVELNKDATAEEVNAAIVAASEGMEGVMGTTTRPLVSIDFNHDPHSSVVALDQTSVQQGNLVRVMSWYDNEWGFSNRMLDTAAAMARA
ncbi:type I glyceraldehyde-3-phosphate dehydrogenase [Sulfitobacter donghicola]|uniref:Glyceraldehyde-3-phosphate dehydrogenase n=1 Tax=Sulfitobacter donghicola DSW-25 = KCTC 12864 = JCM 14565 TaxID=1300350 RepID=A0A073IKF4_9RHOB|nr:type I glyceraldehyde-3-phosphate dehydrogenase [Sulfitobacter donghicola]KEJ90244.1 glyceraldehyde-3-phosphate dehydrogenase [Sulfitobacter donghicola DSW-25 = KCTC 12864 = JCM 14565]KIN66588.1 Glyceraldehyde-3-phosphate dehydrogenase [Sulfitobacter donghicola DSW-25 = KCTC 12864 = JCM 14565]